MDGEIKNKKIETLADDMTKALEENRDGLIQKIIHEEEQKEAEKKQFSPESPRNKRFLLIGTLLLFLALLGIGFAILNRDAFVVDVAPRFTPLIFSDNSTALEATELDKEGIANMAFAILADTEVKKGGVVGMYPTLGKKVLNLSEFMEVIESAFRPTRDNFVSESFMLGAFVTETKPPRPINGVRPTAKGDLFFIFKVRSFVDVFPDMQIWEDRMFADLHDFFRIPVNSSTAYLLTKDFKDAVVQNKNARVLYFDDGKVALMYVYADDSSIVIAQSEEVISEAIARLSASRVKK